MRFTLEVRDGLGPRAGVIDTRRGRIHTPAFMPVGTQAAVKALAPEEVRDTGAEVVLANAYHLYLRPGVETIAALGGLHRFMAWDGPILTDSGGFQVFSLGHLRKLTEEGVRFRSHLDGSEHLYTPEKAMAVQAALGSDIVMPLDVCPAPDVTERKAADNLKLTQRWLNRCVDAYRGEGALFGIAQGAMYPQLRRSAARALGDIAVDGSSIGGLSVGEPKVQTWAMLEESVSELPIDRPRYLMGVGSPEDLVEGVARGVDMFDCALATRLGRHGVVFTPAGRVNLRSATLKRCDAPLDTTCDCYACRSFTTAYLHHLFRAKELLVGRMASIHNLRFLAQLMRRMRSAILAGAFDVFAKDFLTHYRAADEDRRLDQRRRYGLAMAAKRR
jgi:queuine tRNA-ribosyltransferase